MSEQATNPLPGEMAITNLSRVFVALCIAAIVVIIWISVFTRYVMSSPIAWGEQTAKYIMIWAAFVGASLALRSGGHIAFDLLVTSLPSTVSRILTWIGTVLVAAFLVLSIYYGVGYATRALAFSDPVLGGMTMAIPYAAVPAGCVLMLLQLIFVARHSKRAHDDVLSVI